MPQISIVIPTYNRMHLVSRAINSVLKQSYQDFEVIVVDDASVDSTEQLVKQYYDKRILYIKHERRKGASAARNTGIKYARGEYIAFLDSDDEWLPEKLEKQLNGFEKANKKVGVIYTAYAKNDKEGEIKIPEFRGNIFNFILIKNYVGTTSTPLIKKECFMKVGLFDEKLLSAQDWDMWIRIAQIYEFEFITQILVNVYTQDDSISRNNVASIAGHKMISIKYRNHINFLSKKDRAQHFFYIGRLFWWKRDVLEAFKYFIQSFFLHPPIFLSIIQFFMHGIKSFLNREFF